MKSPPEDLMWLDQCCTCHFARISKHIIFYESEVCGIDVTKHYITEYEDIL